jgi:capsular exopolysaccharide synthesis family protein
VGAYPYGGHPAYDTNEGSGDVSGELDLRLYLRLLFLYRWLVAGIVAASLVVGLLYAFMSRPQYKAVVSVFVDRGPSTTVGWAESMAQAVKDEVYYASEQDILKSRQIAQMAFDSLGLSKHQAFAEARDPVGRFMGMISVNRRRDSAIFDVAVEAPYQNDVAAWANALAEAFVRFNLEMNVKAVTDANKLVLSQTKEIEKKYDAMQRRYGAILTENNGYYPQNQKQILDARIQSLEAKKSEVIMQKQETAAKVAELRKIENASRDPLSIVTVRQDPTILGLASQLESLQKELSGLSSRFTPQYPACVKKEQEIATLRGRIRDQALLILSAEEGRLSALSAEESSLNSDIAQLKDEAIRTTTNASQAEGAGADVEAIRKYMQIMNDKLQEMDVAAKLVGTRIYIVDPARTPLQRSKPARMRILLMSLMAGLGVSGLTLTAVQYFDTRVKSVSDFERATGLAAIGLIPPRTEENHSLVIEAFQTLRLSLYYASDQKAKNVVLVTSAAFGEGKSTVVTNLGLILAQSGDRVLLIDGDLRKPSLHKYLKVKADVGLAEYLAAPNASMESFFLTTSTPSLKLMQAGATPANPPALFTMARFHTLITSASREFDWVIIDTPPVLAVADANAMAQQAGLVLLVASYNSSRLPLVKETIEALVRQGHPIAGAVLNRYEWRTSYYYHHYYYYHGTKNPKRHFTDKFIGIFQRPRDPARKTE